MLSQLCSKHLVAVLFLPPRLPATIQTKFVFKPLPQSKKLRVSRDREFTPRNAGIGLGSSRTARAVAAIGWKGVSLIKAGTPNLMKGDHTSIRWKASVIDSSNQ